LRANFSGSGSDSDSDSDSARDVAEKLGASRKDPPMSPAGVVADRALTNTRCRGFVGEPGGRVRGGVLWKRLKQLDGPGGRAVNIGNSNEAKCNDARPGAVYRGGEELG